MLKIEKPVLGKVGVPTCRFGYLLYLNFIVLDLLVIFHGDRACKAEFLRKYFILKHVLSLRFTSLRYLHRYLAMYVCKGDTLFDIAL